MPLCTIPCPALVSPPQHCQAWQLLQVSEHGTEAAVASRALWPLAAHKSGQQKALLRAGLWSGVNHQREALRQQSESRGQYLFTERNTVNKHSSLLLAPVPSHQSVIFTYWEEHRLSATCTSPSHQERLTPGSGRSSVQRSLLWDGDVHATPRLLLPGALSQLHSVSQRWSYHRLHSGLCPPPGTSSALLSWCRAARALGFRLFIAEGSWDGTLWLIYTLAERWLVFWEPSHVAESPLRVTLLTLAIKRILESLSKGNLSLGAITCESALLGKKPSKQSTLYQVQQILSHEMLWDHLVWPVHHSPLCCILTDHMVPVPAVAPSHAVHHPLFLSGLAIHHLCSGNAERKWRRWWVKQLGQWNRSTGAVICWDSLLVWLEITSQLSCKSLPVNQHIFLPVHWLLHTAFCFPLFQNHCKCSLCWHGQGLEAQACAISCFTKACREISLPSPGTAPPVSKGSG